MRRVGSCRLVPDSGSFLDDKVFGLIKVEMLRRVEERLVVWDVVGDEIAGARAVKVCDEMPSS
jgi:hypothetical protein